MSIFELWSLWLLVVFFVSFITGIYCLMGGYGLLIEYSIYFLGSGDISLMFIVDWISMLFLSFVLMISSLVLFYSDEYMGEDNYKGRFCLLVVMFVLSMALLIVSPSFVSILLGWDGLGLVSYCLVVYYSNVSSYNAGMITIMTNRIGDVGILIGIVWFVNSGSWDLYVWNMNGEFILFVGCCVFIAAMTKSAQIPFSAWLPAAMAAPTPVSSLVHSSTLVTAGVYLLIRFNSLFSISGFSMVMLLMSCMTLIMSGVGANFEYDLKKIVALSTLSQLGMMMLALSVGMWRLAYFHMLTHAVFKSLLFLCSGSIIHGVGGGQDIRFMGGLLEMSPVVGVSLNISSLSLMGFPFLSGFYSSDMIIEEFGMGGLNMYIYLLLIISVGLTSCYSLRLSYYVIWGEGKLNSFSSFGDYDSMSKSIMVLTVFSVLTGSMLSWLLFSTPCLIVLPVLIKVLSVIMFFIGVGLGMMFWGIGVGYAVGSKRGVSVILGSMWFLPWLSSNPGLKVLETGVDVLMADLTWSELVGGQGLFEVMKNSSMITQWIQDNSLKLFLFTFMLWFLLVLY
uniref:NADH-ubiquinone oxidoreductase chain 5 n=1 Tax=Eremobates cf. palpisetulosus SEM-2008 TaxID=507470 RepID=B2CKF3_9ARAC|nr:NADH dehydrogenase subunit 5 [Eremobates cf. palpisetulosus SEM-2008]ACA49841.1 NADH dehydrogenase subunit 5 [Eremobates cf. palpisetulosus SEM-2008]